MRHVPIAEFKDRLSELVAAAVAGEEIVITRHGRPEVRLVSVVEDQERKRRAQRAVSELGKLRDDLKRRGVTATVEDWIGWRDEGRQ